MISSLQKDSYVQRKSELLHFHLNIHIFHWKKHFLEILIKPVINVTEKKLNM